MSDVTCDELSGGCGTEVDSDAPQEYFYREGVGSFVVESSAEDVSGGVCSESHQSGHLDDVIDVPEEIVSAGCESEENTGPVTGRAIGSDSSGSDDETLSSFLGK